MEALTTEILKKIIFKEMENIIGLTVEFLKDLGSITKWRGKEYSRGPMAGGMKVTTKMIRKKETEPSIGLMVDNTKAVGRMENSMAWELILQHLENLNKENGKTERDFTGSPTMALINEYKLNFC